MQRFVIHVRKALAATAAATLLACTSSATLAQSAEEIALRSSKVDKVNSWRANARIEIVGDGQMRVREGTIVNQLRDNGYDAMRLYRFDSPADIKGTGMLVLENTSADDDIWLYLPTLGKSRRIVSSNKKNSFVGTEFAFVDLMTQRVGDFDHVSVGRKTIDDVDCWIIESTPKTQKIAEDIGYARERAWVRSDNFATVRIDYFDLRNQPLKSQFIDRLRGVAPERWLAARRRMQNLQNGRETVISFDDIVVNAAVDAKTFRPQQLER